MNGFQLRAIVVTALRTNLRRLTLWIFAAVFGLIAFMLYAGHLRFGGMASTGVKLAVNSDYAIAAMMGAFSFMLIHFTATLTGDPIVKDVRWRTAPLLWSSPIDRRTYVLGKFLGGYASLLSIYAVFVTALLVGQLFAGSDVAILPFRIWPFFKFALLYVFVGTFFVGSLSFCIGTLTGSMKLVYIAATVILIGFVLVQSLLPDEAQRYLAYVEPSGLTWLAESVARSRGNAWLNENTIRPDLGFVLNRAGLVALGALLLGWTVRRFSPTREVQENTGEVTPGLFTRAFRWARGRPAELEDPYTRWVGRGTIPRIAPSEPGVAVYLRQLTASIATELRLLLAERSLWIMVPLIMLICGVDSVTHAGPFQVPIYPVSSEYAQQMVGGLFVLLAGTTIFYTGEVFHRDDAAGARGLVYATPLPNSALLIGKLFSMVLLATFMVAMTVATAMFTQAVQWLSLDGRFYFDPWPYASVFFRVLLPGIVVMCSVALAVNAIVRQRYAAYFTLIGLGALYLWAFAFEGERSLLVNPLAIGHWRYSDITRLEPFAERFTLSHAYWFAVCAALLAVGSYLIERPAGAWRTFLRLRRARGMAGTLAFAAAAVAAALVFGQRIHAAGTLYGTEDELEQAQLLREDEVFEFFEGPHLELASVELDVRLYPEQRGLDVEGTLRLRNVAPEPIATAYFTVDPLFDVRRFELEGQAAPAEFDPGGLCTIRLQRPLQQGEETSLSYAWSGVVNPGIDADGGDQSTFVHESAVFLSSFSPHVVPERGLAPRLFLTDAQRREELDREPLPLLRDRSGEEFVPGILGSLPFDFTARIEAPADLVVVAGGERVGEAPADGGKDRRVTTWRSTTPLRTFAILAADYAVETAGDDEIYHSTLHPYNLDTIREALADGRRHFGEWFGDYPHRALRIVEYPRLASFAQSYPTIMPYSEAIGFLTNHREGERHIDATYFVTAHEVAHQWWGYIVSPGASLGAQVLSESLAEYSASLLVAKTRGERTRLRFLKKEEDIYLRRRDPDTEVPLIELESEGQVIWYQKGCFVLSMLERHLGRERLLAGLRSFVRRWRNDPAERTAASHPTIHDLLDELKSQHRGRDLDWFYRTWFEQVVVPDPALVSAEVTHHGGTWAVDFVVTNRGEGRVPVRLEAVAGEWDLTAPVTPGADVDGDPAREASTALQVWVEPGVETRGTLTARFEPDVLVVDRRFECLDFDRTNNTLALEAQEDGSTPRTPTLASPSE